VYGMPKAAMELGAAVEILPLDQIGRRVAQLMTSTRTTSGSMAALGSPGRSGGDQRD